MISYELSSSAIEVKKPPPGLNLLNIMAIVEIIEQLKVKMLTA